MDPSDSTSPMDIEHSPGPYGTIIGDLPKVGAPSPEWSRWPRGEVADTEVFSYERAQQETEALEQRWEQWKIEPTVPSHILKNKKSSTKKQPLSDEKCRQGWHREEHPDGTHYFVRPPNPKLPGDVALITRLDVRDTELNICPVLYKATDEIMKQAKDNGIDLTTTTSNFILAMDFNFDLKTIGYYFVDGYQRGSLIWAKEYPDRTYGVAEHIQGITEMGDERQAKYAQYWTHFEVFPYGFLSHTLYTDTINSVLYAIAQQAMGDGLYSPYDAEELMKIRSVLESWKGDIHQTNPHAKYIIARMLSMFARTRFYKSINPKYLRRKTSPRVRSVLVTILSLIMFGEPRSQLDRLEGVFADRCVNGPKWKEYLTTAYEDLTGFALYSTVMLVVDVSFLLVPAVGDDTPGNESASTVCTYVSIIAAVGSMALSLLLSTDVRRRRLQRSEAPELLSAMSDSLLFAVTYTLPFALLMWSMIFFLAGLCLRIFPKAAAYTTRSSAVALAILGMAVALPFYTWWRVGHGSAHMLKVLKKNAASYRQNLHQRFWPHAGEKASKETRDPELGAMNQEDQRDHKQSSTRNANPYGRRKLQNGQQPSGYGSYRN